MKNHQFQRTANDFEIGKSRIDLFVWRRCICIYVCIYMWLLEIPVYKEGSIEIPLTVYKEGSIEIPLTVYKEGSIEIPLENLNISVNPKESKHISKLQIN